MVEDKNNTCSNPECRVSETGKCVEGFPLKECPNYSKAEQVSDIDVDQESIKPVIDEEGASEHVISLPLGERLETESAEKVLRANECRVIALIGPVAAGKTTLIASLYGMFGQEPFGGLHFSRSHTLIAFEKACHWARAVSCSKVPRTERTPLGVGLGFYHLGLFNDTKHNVLDLLLGDRSGEAYQDVTHNPSVALEYPEIKRAEIINILVDGKRLSDVGDRHFLQSEAEFMLQGMVDANVLNPQQKLAIVLTKYDLIKASSDIQRVHSDFNSLVDKINHLFIGIFSEIIDFKTAAMPEKNILPRGFGLENLLKFWIKPSPVEQFKSSLKETEPLRAFSRLVYQQT